MFPQPPIFGTHHWTSFGHADVAYDILVEGVEYRCDRVQYDRLCKGVPLDELELIRLDEVDDD